MLNAVPLPVEPVTVAAAELIAVLLAGLALLPRATRLVNVPTASLATIVCVCVGIVWSCAGKLLLTSVTWSAPPVSNKSASIEAPNKNLFARSGKPVFVAGAPGLRSSASSG